MKTLTIIIACVSLVACTKKTANFTYQRTGEVVCTGHDNREMDLHVKATGSSLQDAAFFADISAFENMLYKGIPNSNQETPLIEAGSNSDRMKNYFADFFNNRDYLKFISDQNLTTHDQSGEYHFVEKDITIDVFAFRKYLEDNNIIRKFGLQ